VKNEIYKVIFITAVFLFSCNRGTKNPALRTDDNYFKNAEQCFIAVYQKDSAFLKFKTIQNGKIQGRLVIKYSEPEPNALEKEFYHGEITGKFTKDTLFADFVFADGKNRVLYRNPIALLRKNNKLVLGFGAIVNYLGRSWFIHRQAINFTRSRFQFVPTECNN
jgi:hypothetical protein